jgi:hypothetical protein
MSDWSKVSMPETAACANCHAPISGEFCSACGQRRFRSEDRRFGRLSREFFSALTDLDGRFWRSLRALMFAPGRLSREWIEGRRMRWMSPVALFLFANLVYFLAPALSDFDLPLRNHVSQAVLDDHAAGTPGPNLRSSRGGQVHSRFTESWVRARLGRIQRELDVRGAQSGTAPLRAFDVLERDYDQASANYSKLLIVLHVPFLALGLMLLMWGTRHYYAEHFVVALHFFAFVLCFVQFVVLPGAWLAVTFGVTPGGIPAWARHVGGFIVLAYASLAMRQAYGVGWIRAVASGVAMTLLLVAVNVTIYRALQFAVVMVLA